MDRHNDAVNNRASSLDQKERPLQNQKNSEEDAKRLPQAESVSPRKLENISEEPALEKKELLQEGKQGY